jgi:hypothetical protein
MANMSRVVLIALLVLLSVSVVSVYASVDDTSNGSDQSALELIPFSAYEYFNGQYYLFYTQQQLYLQCAYRGKYMLLSLDVHFTSLSLSLRSILTM